MDFLAPLLAEKTHWVLKRLLKYAKERGYAQYTSTQEEAWMRAIEQMNQALVDIGGQPLENLELEPGGNFGKDPMTAFAIRQAQRHRERGISLAMFMGFMKYFRRAYVELLQSAGLEAGKCARAVEYVIMAFDRMETAICDEWSRLTDTERYNELQTANIALVDEKNSALALLESLPQPVMLLDKCGDIRYLNSAAAFMAASKSNKTPKNSDSISQGLLGSAEADCKSAFCEWCTNVKDAFPWLENDLNEVERSSSKRAVFHHSFNADTTNESYEVCISRLEDVQRNFMGYVVSCADLTRLNRIEAYLGERLTFIQTMMESMPVAVFYKDKAGRFKGCNKAFVDMLGVRRAELLGRTLDEVMPGDVAATTSNVDKRLLANPGVVSYELKGLLKKDPSSEVLVIKSTYNDANGEVAGIIGTFTDITERKQSEKFALETASLLQVILKGIRTGYVLLEVEDFEVVEVNSIAEEITGYTADEIQQRGVELIGLSSQEFVDFMTDIGCQDLAQNITKMEWGRRLLDQEGRLTRKNGEIIPVTRSFLPVSHTDKPHVAIIFFDISERKSLERQLSYSQKLESIGQLAAGIAHEINTPIQYIGDNISFMGSAFEGLLAMVEAISASGAVVPTDNGPDEDWLQPMLDEANYDFMREEIPEAVAQSKEGVGHVTKIVQGIKKFSHPDIEEQRQYDLNAAVENTIVVARNEWKYVADVETDLDPDLLSIRCFPGDLNQVLLNLLVNAAHAVGSKMAEGEKGNILISTKLNGNHAELRVRDSGTGIPENIQDKIFNPFFTTKEVGKGTGQGLSITHSVIVNKHGGTITFETAPGEGTTFIVSLPVEGLGNTSGKAEEEAA